jgi:hypothetical protein
MKKDRTTHRKKDCERVGYSVPKWGAAVLRPYTDMSARATG